MAAKPLPDQATLLKLLRYEPETGKLYWKHRPLRMFERKSKESRRKGAWSSWNDRHAGQEAFTAIAADGYKRGGIFYSLYLAHRVIVCMKTGKRDGFWVLHRNDDRTDNRWANLVVKQIGRAQV